MATEKQEATMVNLVENSGMSVSEAMRQAGYSEAHAKNPQQLTRSRGWKELLDEYIPEHKILERLKKNLDARSETAQNQAVDIAIKLRGKYAAIKVQLEDPYDKLTDEELDAKIAELQTLKKGESQPNG